MRKPVFSKRSVSGFRIGCRSSWLCETDGAGRQPTGCTLSTWRYPCRGGADEHGDDVAAVGKASQALADLSGRLSNAEESQAFKEGMKQSAVASNGITVAFRQLADGMDAHSTALNEGAEELAETLSAALNEGAEELDEAISAVEEKARGL